MLNGQHKKEDKKFKNKPDYQKNMSKRSKTKTTPVVVLKEESSDIPDNDHIELFLNKNIFS